jgi:hypothetical protein
MLWRCSRRVLETIRPPWFQRVLAPDGTRLPFTLNFERQTLNLELHSAVISSERSESRNLAVAVVFRRPHGETLRLRSGHALNFSLFTLHFLCRQGASASTSATRPATPASQSSAQAGVDTMSLRDIRARERAPVAEDIHHHAAAPPHERIERPSARHYHYFPVPSFGCGSPGASREP